LAHRLLTIFISREMPFRENMLLGEREL
jgi:hypothetical protein